MEERDQGTGQNAEGLWKEMAPCWVLAWRHDLQKMGVPGGKMPGPAWVEMTHKHTHILLPLCACAHATGTLMWPPTLLRGLKAQRSGVGLKIAEPPHNPRGVGTDIRTGVSIALSFSIAVQVLGQPKPPLPHHTVNSEKSCLWFALAPPPPSG